MRAAAEVKLQLMDELVDTAGSCAVSDRRRRQYSSVVGASYCKGEAEKAIVATTNHYRDDRPATPRCSSSFGGDLPQRP